MAGQEKALRGSQRMCLAEMGQWHPRQRDRLKMVWGTDVTEGSFSACPIKTNFSSPCEGQTEVLRAEWNWE